MCAIVYYEQYTNYIAIASILISMGSVGSKLLYLLREQEWIDIPSYSIGYVLSLTFLVYSSLYHGYLIMILYSIFFIIKYLLVYVQWLHG